MEFKKFSVGGKIYPDEFDGYEPIKEPDYADVMKDEYNMEGQQILGFFKFLALCHNAVIEK
jgi:hypothetical protein